MDNLITISFIVIAFFFGAIIGNITITDVPMQREALDDACVQLTGDSSAVFAWDMPRATFWGNQKLVCELPSFDSTQNIIIRKNNEESQQEVQDK